MPAPTGSSQLSVMPSSDFCGHQVPTWFTQRHAGKLFMHIKLKQTFKNVIYLFVVMDGQRSEGRGIDVGSSKEHRSDAAFCAFRAQGRGRRGYGQFLYSQSSVFIRTSGVAFHNRPAWVKPWRGFRSLDIIHTQRTPPVEDWECMWDGALAC